MKLLEKAWAAFCAAPGAVLLYCAVAAWAVPASLGYETPPPGVEYRRVKQPGGWDVGVKLPPDEAEAAKQRWTEERRPGAIGTCGVLLLVIPSIRRLAITAWGVIIFGAFVATIIVTGCVSSSVANICIMAWCAQLTAACLLWAWRAARRASSRGWMAAGFFLGAVAFLTVPMSVALSMIAACVGMAILRSPAGPTADQAGHQKKAPDPKMRKLADEILNWVFLSHVNQVRSQGIQGQPAEMPAAIKSAMADALWGAVNEVASYVEDPAVDDWLYTRRAWAITVVFGESDRPGILREIERIKSASTNPIFDASGMCASRDLANAINEGVSPGDWLEKHEGIFAAALRLEKVIPYSE